MTKGIGCWKEDIKESGTQELWEIYQQMLIVRMESMQGEIRGRGVVQNRIKGCYDRISDQIGQ